MHIFKHVGNGFAINDLVDVVSLFVHGDVHRISVAKQVVQVAQDFLICAHEEHTYIIMLLVGEVVQRNGVRRGLAHETGDFAVAVAGNVLQSGQMCRVFVKPLDGNDGEELVDGPKVGQGLEQ